MRVAAYGVFSSVLAMSMADALSAPQAVQYGALTILGWMVWYLLARAFPAHIKAQEKERQAFLEAQEKERAAYLEAQRVTRQEFRESLASLGHSLDCMAVVIGEGRPPNGRSR